jgi:spore coat protein A
MFTRRQLIGRAGAGAAAALTAPAWSRALAAANTPIPPYVQPLPRPGAIRPQPGTPAAIRMAPVSARVHPNAAPSSLWGYNGSTPGPTIEAVSGTPFRIRWTNALPATHIFGVDPALVPHGTTVNTLTHLHGGEVLGVDDGNPYATDPGFYAGQSQLASYPNDQQAATLWYHDHADGMTRLNVMAGLAGFYLVRDGWDTGLASSPLPAGTYELPLAIQDRLLDRSGRIVYPGPGWVPEFFGDVVMVNGAVWPFAEVEPRRYRLRVLNGSNARFYYLTWPGDSGLHWVQIGGDGGFLAAPVTLPDGLLLGPGERADLIVDFAPAAGKRVVLRNHPLPKGVVSPAPRLPSVMQFRVGTRVTTPHKPIPAALPGGGPLALGAPVAVRTHTLEEVLVGGEPVASLINGRRFMDPVLPSEQPRRGTVEEWRFVNLTADSHPVHLHLVQYRVIGRQRFDVPRYQAALDAARAAGQQLNPDVTPYLLGTPRPPASGELCPKDTALAHPGEVLVLRARFDLPAGATTPQRYVYHCHILEHEDNSMMRPYEVVA